MKLWNYIINSTKDFYFCNMPSIVQCYDCNLFISYSNYSRHLKSKKHLNNLNSEIIMVNDNFNEYSLNSLEHYNFQLTKE